MPSRDDTVKVTRPDGSETTVSRAAWGHTYQYRTGWKLVDDQPHLGDKTRDELNAIAAEKGIADAASLPNKDAVIAAIEGAT